MAYKVFLDSGHGGWDNGVIYHDRIEKKDNLNLVLAVGKILTKKGIDVGYTRTTDVYDSPFEKTLKANNANADMFISIHRNSSPYPNTYSGVQSLIYDNKGIKEVAANNINDELSKVGYNNLGISVKPNLVVLKSSTMPVVLVEVGFINTDVDNVILDSRFHDVVNAIATGILKTIAYPKRYRVQVGLFRDYTRAKNLLNSLIEQGNSGVIVPFDDLYAVRIGEFANLDAAVRFERELNKKEYETLVVEG